jgi:hypothetical protein
LADLWHREARQWQRIKEFSPCNLGLLGSKAGGRNQHANNKKHRQTKLKQFPHDEFPYLINQNDWQSGDLGVLRGVAEGVAEEARTRDFASLTLVRFAFVNQSFSQTEKYRQFWDVRKLEPV